MQCRNVKWRHLKCWCSKIEHTCITMQHWSFEILEYLIPTKCTESFHNPTHILAIGSTVTIGSVWLIAIKTVVSVIVYSKYFLSEIPISISEQWFCNRVQLICGIYLKQKINLQGFGFFLSQSAREHIYLVFQHYQTFFFFFKI